MLIEPDCIYVDVFRFDSLWWLWLCYLSPWHGSGLLCARTVFGIDLGVDGYPWLGSGLGDSLVQDPDPVHGVDLWFFVVGVLSCASWSLVSLRALELCFPPYTVATVFFGLYSRWPAEGNVDSAFDESPRKTK